MYRNAFVRELLTGQDDMYLAGHAASIQLTLGGKTQRIGSFGIMHPTVLKKFELM